MYRIWVDRSRLDTGADAPIAVRDTTTGIVVYCEEVRAETVTVTTLPRRTRDGARVVMDAEAVQVARPAAN
jgi:hypothetical protein